MSSTKEQKVLAQKGWVSLAQAAKIIGVSYPTILSYKKKGKIRFVRIGGVHRVTAVEISRILRGEPLPEGETEES